jgi:hypothetical protein
MDTGKEVTSQIRELPMLDTRYLQKLLSGLPLYAVKIIGKAFVRFRIIMRSRGLQTLDTT